MVLFMIIDKIRELPKQNAEWYHYWYYWLLVYNTRL